MTLNSLICLPGSVLEEVDGVVGATEPGVVALAESKIKQTNKNWVMLNMCSVLTLNPDELGV